MVRPPAGCERIDPFDRWLVGFVVRNRRGLWTNQHSIVHRWSGPRVARAFWHPHSNSVTPLSLLLAHWPAARLAFFPRSRRQRPPFFPRTQGFRDKTVSPFISFARSTSEPWP